MVDRYSGYPFVQSLASTTAVTVMRALAEWWELFGFPSVVRADGGPHFPCQEFLAFCSERDIKLETSSPNNLRSNGLAEAAVKNCKKLLLNCISGGVNYADALLEFRNCPRPAGSHRCSSCSAGACGRPSRRLQERLSRFPWRRRRRQGRKHMKQLWRELEPAVWKNSMKGMKCGCRIGLLGFGGASFSIYFPDSEEISWRNEHFLRMKKSGGEIRESDESRKIANSQ